MAGMIGQIAHETIDRTKAMMALVDVGDDGG
jgi:hypothetical protein